MPYLEVVIARNVLHRQHRGAVALVAFDQLSGDSRGGVDQVVGQDHREGLVAHHRLRAQHRVPESERLGLPDVDEGHPARGGRHQRLEQLVLAAALEHLLQLGDPVEVILDSPLVASGDENHLLHAGRRGFLHGVLDQRFVTTGNISFGIALVAGRNRVPMPATGNTALRTLLACIGFPRFDNSMGDAAHAPAARVRRASSCFPISTPH